MSATIIYVHHPSGGCQV